MSSSDAPTRLPYDILALIVHETANDPPSLASWCLVSFAMLELAAPLLYEKLELKGEKDYIDLFKDLAIEYPNPALNRFFDLRQLRHLVLGSPPSLQHPGASRPHSRFNKNRTTPVPLPTLEIVANKAIAPNYPFKPQDIVPQGCLANFLTSLAPDKVTLQMEGSSSSTTYAGARSSVRVDVALAPVVGRWRSLKEMEVTGLVLTGKELLFVTTLLQVRPVESRRLQSYTITLKFNHSLPPPSSPLWVTETLRSRFENEFGETSGIKSVEGIRLFFRAEEKGKRVSSQVVQEALEKIKSATEEDGGHKVGIFLYWRGRGGVEEFCRAEEYGGGTEVRASEAEVGKSSQREDWTTITPSSGSNRELSTGRI